MIRCRDVRDVVKSTGMRQGVVKSTEMRTGVVKSTEMRQGVVKSTERRQSLKHARRLHYTSIKQWQKERQEDNLTSAKIYGRCRA